jgi:hypothetical protein
LTFALATWFAAPRLMPRICGSCRAPVSGRLIAFNAVTSSGFWSDALPGALALAYFSSTIESSVWAPSLASRKLPTDCASGLSAALALCAPTSDSPPTASVAATVPARTRPDRDKTRRSGFAVGYLEPSY